MTDKHPQRVVQDYLDALLFDPETDIDVQCEAPAPAEPDVQEVPDEGAGAEARSNAEMIAAFGAEEDLVADEARAAVQPDDDAEARADAAMMAAYAAAEASGPTAEPEPATAADDAESRANAAMLAAHGQEDESAADEAPAPRRASARKSADNPTLAYRPASLADEFNCVMVRMHGLNLALPFDQVEGVQPLKAVSLMLDRAHDWVLGRYESRTGQVQVVDTALWLIRDRYNPELAKYQEALVLPGRHWALACDELVRSLPLSSDQVKWNGNRKQRPWLLGTYLPERCFLVDVPVLLEQFESAFSAPGDTRGIL